MCALDAATRSRLRVRRRDRSRGSEDEEERVDWLTERSPSRWSRSLDIPLLCCTHTYIHTCIHTHESCGVRWAVGCHVRFAQDITKTNSILVAVDAWLLEVLGDGALDSLPVRVACVHRITSHCITAQHIVSHQHRECCLACVRWQGTPSCAGFHACACIHVCMCIERHVLMRLVGCTHIICWWALR
jgi:hypothetical protein